MLFISSLRPKNSTRNNSVCAQFHWDFNNLDVYLCVCAHLQVEFYLMSSRPSLYFRLIAALSTGKRNNRQIFVCALYVSASACVCICAGSRRNFKRWFWLSQAVLSAGLDAQIDKQQAKPNAMKKETVNTFNAAWQFAYYRKFARSEGRRGDGKRETEVRERKRRKDCEMKT